jgi:hypothetical protein
MLPPAEHEYGGVAFAGTPGTADGSFAAAFGPVQPYGLADGDAIQILCLRGPVPLPGPRPDLIDGAGGRHARIQHRARRLVSVLDHRASLGSVQGRSRIRHAGQRGTNGAGGGAAVAELAAARQPYFPGLFQVTSNRAGAGGGGYRSAISAPLPAMTRRTVGGVDNRAEIREFLAGHPARQDHL